MSSLPVASPADDRRAWSDYGGMWHVVDVRYRARGPLGFLLWGRTGWQGIGTALATGGIVAMIALVGSILVRGLLGVDFGDPLTIALVLGVLAALGPLGMAVADLVARRGVEGQVVRRRRYRAGGDSDSPRYDHWIAIDEGTSRQVHAYGIDPQKWQELTEGDLVRLRVGRRLGWIYDTEVLAPSRHR